MEKEYKSNLITLIKKYLPVMEENIKHIHKDEYLGKTLNDYPDEIGWLWNLLIKEKVNSLLNEDPGLLKRLTSNIEESCESLRDILQDLEKQLEEK